MSYTVLLSTRKNISGPITTGLDGHTTLLGGMPEQHTNQKLLLLYYYIISNSNGGGSSSSNLRGKQLISVRKGELIRAYIYPYHHWSCFPTFACEMILHIKST